MSSLQPNNNYHYYWTSANEAEDDTNEELSPDMTFPVEYTSNTLERPTSFGLAQAVSQPTSHQTMNQLSRTLPPPPTREVDRLPESQVNQPRKYRDILPALPSGSRHSHSHPYPPQGNQGTAHQEGSLTTWSSNGPTTRSNTSGQTTVQHQGLTLPPLWPNAENPPPTSTSPVDLSPQSSRSVHSEETQGLKCKWKGCRYVGTFGRAAELRRHTEHIHKNPKLYVCDFKGCGSIFNRRDNLRAHQKKHDRA